MLLHFFYSKCVNSFVGDRLISIIFWENKSLKFTFLPIPLKLIVWHMSTYLAINIIYMPFNNGLRKIRKRLLSAQPNQTFHPVGCNRTEATLPNPPLIPDICCQFPWARYLVYVLTGQTCFLVAWERDLPGTVYSVYLITYLHCTQLIYFLIINSFA